MNKGKSGCTEAKPCRACAGDCDTDGDCDTGLACWQRSSSTSKVPGCVSGGLHSDVVRTPPEVARALSLGYRFVTVRGSAFLRSTKCPNILNPVSVSLQFRGWKKVPSRGNCFGQFRELTSRNPPYMAQPRFGLGSADFCAEPSPLPMPCTTISSLRRYDCDRLTASCRECTITATTWKQSTKKTQGRTWRRSDEFSYNSTNNHCTRTYYVWKSSKFRQRAGYGCAVQQCSSAHASGRHARVCFPDSAQILRRS